MPPKERLTKELAAFEELNSRFREVVKCSKLERNLIGMRKQLACKITSHTWVHGRFFSKSYTTYLVVTTGDGGTLFEVERRFSQFDSLVKALKRDFPGVYVPPIPPASLINSTEEVIEQRKVCLNQFLQAVTAHEILRQSPHFEAFVTVKESAAYAQAVADIDADQREAQASFEDYTLSKFEKGLQASRFKTSNGYFEAVIDESVQTAAEESEKYFVQAKSTLQQLLAKLSASISAFESAQSQFDEAFELIGSFSSLTDKYRSSTKEIQNTWGNLVDMSSLFQECIANMSRLQ